MLFYSYEFLFFFLPLSFFTYYLFLHYKCVTAAKLFLVSSSLFFYAWWNVMYLPILIGSVLFNYFLSKKMRMHMPEAYVSKKKLLIFGISSNVLLLAYFKYSDFLITNFNVVMQSDISLLNLALPLAISFFTFQQIAYLVDTYFEKNSEKSFLNYTLFVTFFPQLIAGPIVHHSEMMPQFSSRWNLVKKYHNIAQGLSIFAMGLFKKVVIADSFAVYATTGFDHAHVLTFLEAWATSLSYTFQIYFDFSGYTDMAIGIALLFNIKLPQNFNSPYKAINIQDFWRRWHMTLSRFLRDYIYIPLGGSRNGTRHTYVNIFTTFLLAGLWHGAGWTFVFWGFLHGLALVVHSIWRSFKLEIPKVIAWTITFVFINISWVFFRSEELSDAVKVLKGMLGFSGFVLSNTYENLIPSWIMTYVVLGMPTVHIGDSMTILAWIVVGFSISIVFRNSNEIIENYKYNWFKSVGVSFLIFTSLMYLFFGKTAQSEFLYFNF